MIEDSFDHRAILHRATVLRDELQDATEVWVAQTTPAGRNCMPHRNWSGAQVDHGPGEQQSATRQWFLHKGFDPRERDVLEIVSGPEAGTLQRILSKSAATAPIEVHHYEVVVEVWHGSLTEPEVES